MFNISLALAFLMSFHFSLGGEIISLIIPSDALRLLPPYQQHIATNFANYWLPVLILYIFLRSVNAHKYLRPTTGIQFLLGSANAVLITYLILRIFASNIPGGGASFALVSFSAYILIPCKIALYAGTAWLIAHAFWLNYKKIPASESEYQPLFKTTSGIIAVAMLLPPMGYFTWFYSTNYKQINTVKVKLKEANSRFDELCDSAVIEIKGRVKKPDGVFFNGSNQFYMRMLNELDFVEVDFRNNSIQRITKKDNKPAFVNFKIQDVNREQIFKPSARYEVMSKWPQNPADRKLGIISKETIILDRTNNQILAKYLTVRRTKGSMVMATCPKNNFYFFEGNIAKYVLGLTDELKAEGLDVRMSQNLKY